MAVPATSAKKAPKTKRTTVESELQALYVQHGALNPHTVVDWAREHPASALHSRFEWDDTAAAEKYRVWQARQLIVEVRVIYPDSKPRQVYVSPRPNRGKNGGYTRLVEVMSDVERRKQFLEQALQEYERVGDKYADLQELAGVRAAVDAARKKAAKS